MTTYDFSKAKPTDEQIIQAVRNKWAPQIHQPAVAGGCNSISVVTEVAKIILPSWDGMYYPTSLEKAVNRVRTRLVKEGRLIGYGNGAARLFYDPTDPNVVRHLAAAAATGAKQAGDLDAAKKMVVPFAQHGVEVGIRSVPVYGSVMRTTEICLTVEDAERLLGMLDAALVGEYS